ncbi:hypothetical protein [Empedobacter stercoris]|uniref:Uncharacterized protein n=1 Tax=Empedobacter stercoris TaxID=1628248 RepID=A0ABX1WLH0_9FLAO|nr:hypothetical protein [Empedobacter stercoris]NOJ75477.1 hypothetical protein [Empedobacter stercoris]
MGRIHKSDSYYIEKFSPIFLGLIAGVLCYYIGFKFNINFTICRNLIFNFPPIGLTIFGFGLTLLAILIQSNSEFVIRIRNKHEELFNKVINKNKELVYISLLLSIFSYLLSFMYSLNHIFLEVDLNLYLYIKLFIISLFFASIIYLFLTLYFFIKSFYLIITQK